jgi:hypothetical protein
MATAKTPNYTDEQVAQLKAGYNPEATEAERKAQVEALATTLGRSGKSITAKLVKMGVYVAKQYVSKNGEKPVKKDAHADAIGKVLGLTEPDTESLTKANKSALVKVFTALANSVPREVESDADEAAKPALVEVLRRVAGLSDDEAKSLSRVSRATLAKLAAPFQDEIADE